MNTNIENLLDRTAEYLLKYDASEDGKKCADAIQNYYEYRPNFILGCLDYARKFAYKAQTIDIDEDANEFISVVNKAYHAWASSMKTQNENITKNKIIITEKELKQIVAESVKNVLTELDWKTYANAAKKRWAQGGKNMIKAQELGRMADKRFNDDYVGDWKYDTMGDKLKGKHSSTFDAHINPTKDNIAYSAIKGKNKNGTDIFTTGKGKYKTGMGGVTTPGKHFRDTEIANAYSRANDELWDYADGNYEYQKGKGWNKK